MTASGLYLNLSIGSADAPILQVDTTIATRGITAIFGPSGSGKTTLLRCIAGLTRATSGNILFNGAVWQDQTQFLAPHKRPIGYVFQDANLFCHLTALGNLQFAIKRANNASAHQLLDKVVALLGLQSLLNRYPSQLSGGEKQRVAIARALLICPQLLLMDEPLASLDEQRKQEILPYLEALHEEFSTPILYVSHAMNEVARLADNMLVLNNGTVVAHGNLNQVLTDTQSPTAQGEDTCVVLNATVESKDTKWQLICARISNAQLWIKAPDHATAINQTLRVRILARDVSLSLSEHSDSSILNKLAATVISISDDTDSAMALVKLAVGSDTLLARITRKSAHHLALQPNMQLWAQVKSVAIVG